MSKEKRNTTHIRRKLWINFIFLNLHPLIIIMYNNFRRKKIVKNEQSLYLFLSCLPESTKKENNTIHDV